MLKHGKPADVQRMFRRLTGEAKSLLEECTSLSYFMRGAVPYEQMMRRTFIEREIMSEFVKDHLEREMKKSFPIY